MRKLYDCDVGCPVQNTLQFIAGKWKSVILYHLFENTVLRFSELQEKYTICFQTHVSQTIGRTRG